MKQVDIKSIVIPNKPRSGNYPVGSTVVRGGSSSGGSYPDLSLYLLKAIWERNIEERKDENGNEYLLFKKSIVSEGGVTAYALGDRTPSTIMDGVVVDGTTIVKENGVLKALVGSNFDEEAMWTALDSSDSDRQINLSHLSNALSSYATQSWVRSQNYATQSSLNSVSQKLNDFLEGSDTDTIINKWKELEAFLSGMTESDNLAEILSTKADKSYVDSELEKYVTLSTEQEITGLKHFINGLSVGSSKHRIYEQDGVVYLDGDLAVTGGVTAYALGDRTPSTILDGLIIDETTLSKEGGKLSVIGGVGGASNWDDLEGKPDWIGATKPTYNWSEILAKPTTLAGFGITDAYNKSESDGRYLYNYSNGYSGDVRNIPINTFVSAQNRNITNAPSDLNAELWSNILTFAWNDNSQYKEQLLISNGRLYSQGRYGGGWNKIAFITDTVASSLNADMLDGIHANNLLYVLDDDFDPNTYDGYYVGMTTESGIDTNWWHIISMNWGNSVEGISGNKIWTSQLALPTQNRNGLRYRSGNGNSAYGSWVKVWDESNDGEGSGLDADTVDGVHNGSLQANTISYNGNAHQNDCVQFIQSTNQNDAGDLPSNNWYTVMKMNHGDGDSYYNRALAFDFFSERIYTRKRTSGTAYNWLTLAFTTDNVASATRLQTGRYIWGQYFDGQQNVDGCIRIQANEGNYCEGIRIKPFSNWSTIMLGGSDLTSTTGTSANSWSIHNNNGNFWLNRNNSNGHTGYELCNVNGNWGIGTTSPEYKLDVNGDIRSSSRFVFLSTYGDNSISLGNGDNATFATHNMKIRAWWGLGIHDFTDTCRIVFDARTGKIVTTGSIGIGTESPSAALHVVGDILATGGITCYTSDSRAKTILEELNLSLKDIAESPTIRFKWNGWKIKDDDKTHIGGIAQYVQKILPETILEADGMLNLDYATTAYIYAVQTARHLTKTDTEVDKLKRRIKKLEKQLKKLGYEEINTLVN